MIEVGKDYIYTGSLSDVKIKVLAEDKNSSGDKIYACKDNTTGKLFWSSKHNLEPIVVKKFTPLQEDFMNSEKQHINLIACGKGAGTTIAFFENIINSGSRANNLYYSSRRDAEYAFRMFCEYCQDVGVGISNLTAHGRFWC